MSILLVRRLFQVRSDIGKYLLPQIAKREYRMHGGCVADDRPRHEYRRQQSSPEVAGFADVFGNVSNASIDVMAAGANQTSGDISE